MEAGEIKKLDETVINRIAAGEIIQRPSNACKELIENSLDAKASVIHIIVKSGGLKLLQIQDNGTGIHFSNLEVICERFTTSKITTFEDLSRIHTFGFRGEALSSISHIARLSIQTKIAQDPWGYRALYENGKLIEKPKRCAAKQGTIIRVEDLFYNTSQRRCCFYSASEEYQKICNVVVKYAVHNPHIAFILQKFNEQPSIKTSTNSTKEINIRSIYGTQIATNLLRIEVENNKGRNFKMLALMTTPHYFAKTPHFILFINHRLVDSIALRNSIEKAYSLFIPKGTYPFTYIELEMNPSNIDVNVHPTKQEVHFLYEEEIIELIRVEIENHLLKIKNTQSLYKQLKLPMIKTDDCESEQKLQLNSIIRSYDKDIVRTDAQEQKLETFLSHMLLKTSNCSTSRYIKKRKKKYCYPNLSSIMKMRDNIDCNISISLRETIKSLVYVGSINKTFALIQFQKSLCLCNTLKLSEELFYQLIIYNFQNFSSIEIQPKLSIKSLVALAISSTRKKIEKIHADELAENAELVLINKAPIMQEYFGLGINSKGELETLPILLSNYFPSLSSLPNYILRLATKVEWEAEEKCFDTFARETAQFYARISSLEFKTKKWMVEHIIFPALKRFLKPPDNLKKYIFQLTTLPKLYKVFERC